MAIQLDAPIELENMLPFSITLEMVDKTRGISSRNVVPKGERCHIHTINTYNHVAMSIKIPEAGEYMYMTKTTQRYCQYQFVDIIFFLF